MVISSKQFSDILNAISDFTSEKKMAVAVSGGGDSMALAFLLSKFCAKYKIELHILTVDHGLRKEAAAEAKQVALAVKRWENVVHKTLKWTGDKPKTRIQEEARKARYALMGDYCRKQRINYLLLGHHGGDQIETFLFRLAKGSGIDGLAVMPVLQETGEVTLVRPLLGFPHEDLIAICRKNKIDWIEDPSNEADKYARVRLRQSRDILEAEGLTASRILTLAMRMERAREALEKIAAQGWNETVRESVKGVNFDLKIFWAQPEEIGLRLLQRALAETGKKRTYPPSLQILEKITREIYTKPEFRAATLGGCVIRVSRRRNLVEIRPE